MSFFIILVSYTSISWSHGHAGNDFYAGLKFGTYSTGTESSYPIGLQIDYKLNSYVFMEVDYLHANAKSSGIDQGLDTLGAYGVFRTKNTTYVLAKLGGSIVNDGQNKFSLSYGLGAGVVLNSQVSLESEFTVLNSDLSYLGITIRCGY